MQLLNVWKVNYMDSVSVLLQLDTSCQQLLVTGLLKQTKKGEKTVATATLLCAPGARTVFQRLPTALAAQTSLKRKRKIKQEEYCHIATCLEYVTVAQEAF